MGIYLLFVCVGIIITAQYFLVQILSNNFLGPHLRSLPIGFSETFQHDGRRKRSENRGKSILFPLIVHPDYAGMPDIQFCITLTLFIGIPDLLGISRFNLLLLVLIKQRFSFARLRVCFTQAGFQGIHINQNIRLAAHFILTDFSNAHWISVNHIINQRIGVAAYFSRRFQIKNNCTVSERTYGRFAYQLAQLDFLIKFRYHDFRTVVVACCKLLVSGIPPMKPVFGIDIVFNRLNRDSDNVILVHILPDHIDDLHGLAFVALGGHTPLINIRLCY